MYGSLDNALAKQGAICRSIPQSTLLGNFCGHWGLQEAVPASVYEGSVEIPFESLTITVPKGYDQYLTALYGNYMEFPRQCKKLLTMIPRDRGAAALLQDGLHSALRRTKRIGNNWMKDLIF